MKLLGMMLAVSLVGVACGEEPQSASSRLGLRFEQQLPPVAASPILNPPSPSGVIELPRFDVKAAPARLDPDELLTDAGRLAAAKERFISPLYAKTYGPLAQLGEYYLNFFSLLGGWHPNDKEALALYDQDLRRRKLKTFDNLLEVSKVASPDEAKELLALRNESFRRDQPSGPDGAHPLFILRRGPFRP